MTTISWDTNILAADSRCMLGDTILQYGVEKIYYPGPDEFWSVFGHKVLAYGLSGNLDAVPWINEMLAEGVDHHSCCPAVDNLVFHVILVTESRHAYSWYMERIQSDGVDDSGLVPIHGPFAVGSGAPFALAVMAIGFSAEKAVEVACKLDTGTGGDVEVYSPPPKPAVLSVRPGPQHYMVERFAPQQPIPGKPQETAQEIFDRHFKSVVDNYNPTDPFEKALFPLVNATLFKIEAQHPNWHGFSNEELESVRARVAALPADMDVLEKAKQTVVWLEELKPVSPKTLEQRMIQFEKDRRLLLDAPVDEEEPMD